ncbi:nuclear transport factor 2 family protein [Amycolatopsis pigmentata]|uniref:Nuclear transport factor 2 family protein n=1 Tax=Amycolatopsis pigmentata TaxID=450801 RepID=A0ABW5FWC1_9PSEU
MKIASVKMIAAAATLVGLSGLAITAGPARAANPAGTQAHTVTSGAVPTDLSPRDLSTLPLANSHLTERERANLAVVLAQYHAAEGNSMDVPTFVENFAGDGVFTDVVAGQTYKGNTLGDVLYKMHHLFPDVHRDLKRITVSGDVISIELSIQGTFSGTLETPAGTVQPNGAKIDVPTADFWYLKDGKIEKFNCYVGYSDLWTQLGINIDWASAVAKG